MNKKIIIAIIIVVALGIVTVMARNNNQQSDISSANEVVSGIQTPNIENYVDKIEVVHFHGTHQCWSCITVGDYALKTIQERFPEEYQNGIILFKDINGELPENKDIVMKYQARGSSLFVNAITDNQDNIKEDTTVWQLVSDENKYISYFENKLKNLLGK